jgi:hypothetical protein
MVMVEVFGGNKSYFDIKAKTLKEQKLQGFPNARGFENFFRCPEPYSEVFPF